MKAVIEVDVPEYQIGQEVSVYFKDTMCIKGVCQKDDTIEEFEKIIAKIDFEEKWLLDVYAKEYRVSANDIKIAMSGIRSVVSGLKGDNKQSRCNNCQNNTDELSGECYECVKGIEDWYEPISEPKGEAE